MIRFFGILMLSIMVGSVLGCGLRPTATPTPTVMPTPCVGPTITLGEIADDPNKVKNNSRAFANYLAEGLAPLGIACGDVEVVETVNGMIELIKNGEVDIYFDSMYPATLVSDATGARPILRRWRNCDPEYYSIIFTLNGSGITSIDDLRGHMIAMDRPDSTSGFALPAMYLIDHGLKLVVKDSFSAPVAPDEVAIFFSKADKNTLHQVLDGKVSAGATDDYNYDNWVAEETPGKFIDLAHTESVLRQVVLVRPGLESNLRAAIKDELLKANSNPKGVAALNEAAATCKFDDVPVEIEAAFGQMRDMHATLKDIPGWAQQFQLSQILATPTPVSQATP